MWKTVWDWTKFVTLMLYVGVIPFTIDLPAPLILALVAVAMIAATATAMQQTRVEFGAIAARIYTSFPSIAPSSSERLPLPEAPGTPGTVRSRAPSLFSAALG